MTREEKLRQEAERLGRHWQKGKYEYVWRAITRRWTTEDACAIALYVSRLITDEEKTDLLNYFINPVGG